MIGEFAWRAVVGVLGGLLMIWLGLLTALRWWAGNHPDTAIGWREALRLVTDLIVLFRRLAQDRSIGRGIRTRSWLLLAYLAMPIDLVPDFIPVIGYADDAIVIAVVLRSVIRHAGVAAVHRHWPGSAAGLGAVLRLTGRGSP